MNSAQGKSYLPRDIFYLGVLLVVASFLSQLISWVASSDGDSTAAAETVEQIAERIRPVMTLEDILAGGVAAGAGVAQKTPQELYQGACMACHAAGVAGAPKVGDGAAWQARMANGIDGLVASAIAGKGAMPPKGGSSYSEDELRAVVEYMLGESGL